MPVTVFDFGNFLAHYIPNWIFLRRFMYIWQGIVNLRLLIELHIRQFTQAHQPPRDRGGWYGEIGNIIRVLGEEELDDCAGPELPPAFTDRIHANIEDIYEMMELGTLVTEKTPPPLICTKHTHCPFCMPRRILHKSCEIVQVTYISESFATGAAWLVVAHCRQCDAKFYPDRISRQMEEADGTKHRVDHLECDAEVLMIAKGTVWVHRRLASMQQTLVYQNHMSFIGFANYFNETFPGRKFRRETSQRLFVEHFLRRLIKAYGITNTFFLSPSASSDEKVKQFIEFIGERLRIFPWARSHTCSSCTREKQPQQRALDPAIAIDAVAEINDEVPVDAGHEPAANEEDINIVERLREIERAAGNIEEQGEEEKQYIRMAVMDGKTLHHRICAVRACRNPLVNYKNGRFCANHQDKQDKCAFETCNAPVGEGRPVCLDPEHILQYNKWTRRFGRVSHRTITRYYHEGVNNSDSILSNENQEHVPNQDRLTHTLRARRLYCIETCQWACGIPIGWGKMYEAESPTQVLEFLDTLWPPEALEPRPSFIAYDNACKVLRHLGTHHLGGTWIRTTRFIVDAFHYVTHTKKDVLCRTFCNPSPLNGSNPDLIKTIEINGVVHKKRAFNTETAEQLNAWLSGYEVQVSQMTHLNFDFFITAMLQLHGETLQRRIAEKEDGGILGLAEPVDDMILED